MLVRRSAGWQPGELEGIEGVGVIVGSDAYWVRAAYFVAITWVMKLSVGMIGVVGLARVGVMVDTTTAWVLVGGVASDVSCILCAPPGEHAERSITSKNTQYGLFNFNTTSNTRYQFPIVYLEP